MSVIYGFGDIRRGAKIWLLELAIALAFYPGLRLYAGTRKFLVKFPGKMIKKYLLFTKIVSCNRTSRITIFTNSKTTKTFALTD